MEVPIENQTASGIKCLRPVGRPGYDADHAENLAWGDGSGRAEPCCPVLGQHQRTLPQAQVFPAAEWARHTDPASAGYCQPGLDAATTQAKGMATTAAMAVVGGRVLWDYGDQQFISYLASVRKSILAMLFGNYVERGTIKLDKTMKDLNITDVQGLLPREQQATSLQSSGRAVRRVPSGGQCRVGRGR